VEYGDDKCGAFTTENMENETVTSTKAASVWLPDQMTGYLTQPENRLRDFHENFLLSANLTKMYWVI